MIRLIIPSLRFLFFCLFFFVSEDNLLDFIIIITPDMFFYFGASERYTGFQVTKDIFL